MAYTPGPVVKGGWDETTLAKGNIFAEEFGNIYNNFEYLKEGFDSFSGKSYLNETVIHGMKRSVDEDLASNSDEEFPTVKAVKAFAEGVVNGHATSDSPHSKSQIESVLTGLIGSHFHTNDYTWINTSTNGGIDFLNGFQSRWGNVYNDSDNTVTYSFNKSFNNHCSIVVGNVSSANMKSDRPIYTWSKSGFSINRNKDIGDSSYIAYIAVGK